MTLVPLNDVTTADTLALVPSAFDLAQRIATTDFVPRALRGKPEAVMACILTGHEVGIGAMQALSKIHVIEGRPAMSAELMRALVLRGGHELWIEESSSTSCTVAGKRAGSTRETKITWTIEDAKRAGLVGKANWRQYPAAMLLARASAALTRAVFPEVLAGLSYAVEELEDGDVFDIEDDTVDVAPTVPTKRRKARKAITAKATAAPAAPATDALEAREEPPLPGEDAYDGPDEHLDGPKLAFPQWAGMKATEVGLTEDHRHALWRALTGGRAGRATDLDDGERVEARTVLADLEAGRAALGTAGDGDYVVVLATGALRHASGPVEAGIRYELLAPPAHAGKAWTAPSEDADVPEATPDLPDHPQSDEAADPAPTTPETPPAPPPPPPDPLGDDDDFVTADGWRAWMKTRDLKVADVIRAATDVFGELRLGEANVPRKLDDVAGLDAGTARTIRQRLVEGRPE